MNAGRLAIERTLESAEVRDAERIRCGDLYVICDAQAGWAQEDEAVVVDGGADAGVKSPVEDGDEEETVEVGGRRRGRKVGDDL